MRGVGFLLDLFKKAGGWPVLEGSNWDGDNFDWVENIYKLHELGLSGELFEINVSTDRLDSFKKVIEVSELSPVTFLFLLSFIFLINVRTSELWCRNTR